MWTAAGALLLQITLVVLAAVVARRAKPAAIAFGAAAFLGVPWLAGPTPLLRGLCALVGGIGLIRVIDVTRSPVGEGSASRRLLHVVSFVDTRTLRRAPPHIEIGVLTRALLWAAVGAAGFYFIHSPRHLVRLGGGLVFAYAVIESGYALIGAAYRAIGFVTPPLHVLPIASLSIGELWGKRWARPVSAWLRENCFVPHARRGHPLTGLVLGFVASGLGHAYAVLVATDLPMATMMFAFFVVQAVFVVLELRLGASRWPRAARRVWTVAIMVASSPLFVEPVLRVL